VLRGITCRFSNGRTVLLGVNGAGKSTLFRLMAGVLVHLQGSPRSPGRAGLARGVITGQCRQV
jgi:ABC-type Mn2+/Zn2+ transport system ATPase subunit